MFASSSFLTTCANLFAKCAVLFISIVILYICYLEFFAFDLPENLPSVGFPGGLFSRTRASVRQVFKSPQDVEEGYKKVRNSLQLYMC